MVAAAVLVVVCAGIYVNWLYTQEQSALELDDTLDADKVMSDELLILPEDAAVIAAGEDPMTVGEDYSLATFSNFISISEDVVEAEQPSTIFCFPDRAACIIWSIVRSPLLRYLCAK